MRGGIDTVYYNAKNRSALALKLKNPCHFSDQQGGMRVNAVNSHERFKWAICKQL